MYLATDLSAGVQAPEGTEVLQVKTVPFDDALEMVDHGEITDGLSIIALMRAARLRDHHGEHDHDHDHH